MSNISSMSPCSNASLLDSRTTIYKTSVLLTSTTLVPVSLLICFSVIINIIVILSYLRTPRLHTNNNIHVASLAAADLLVSTISMPVTTIRMSRNENLISGSLFCSCWPFVDFFLTNISVFNLVNIAIDRYRAVCWPFSYSQDKSKMNSPRLKCLTAWVMSCLLSLPILTANVDTDTCAVDMCHVPWLIFYLPVICFVLPSTIIIILYGIIACTIMKKTKIRTRSSLAFSHTLTTVTSPMSISSVAPTRIPSRNLYERRMSKSYDTGLNLLSPQNYLGDNHLLVQSSPNLNINRLDVHKPSSSLPLLLKTPTRSTTNSSLSDFLDDPLAVLRYQTFRRIQGNVSREKRLAVVTCLLITVFILCYLPFWSVYTCLAFYPTCPEPEPSIMAFVMWLTLVSAALNPLVYTGFNKDFRKAIGQTLTSGLRIVQCCSTREGGL